MLLKQLQKTLETEVKPFFLKNRAEIIDILLFGSVVKGKNQPNDIDILILFHNDKQLKLCQELRKKIEEKIEMKIEVTGLSYSELFNKSFLPREAILTEAYSLIYKNSISESLGFRSQIMFNYKLKGKTKSERMKFYYSLHGRNAPGMLKRLAAIKYTETIILCPVENQEKMREYLNSWNLEFKETPLLIPARLL